MGKLLQLIAKLFGKNAISKTLGTRTNVIKLPSNEKKRLIKDELNIEAASDLAAQKVLKEAEDLIADIPKMNDQEVLTFTGNLQRLDNKINPPSAEVLDLTTKKPVTGEGLEQLAARDGLPADVSPDSPIGRVMQGAQILRKEKDELDKMLKDPAKQLEQEMQNPYRSGGPLDPKMGIVRTAARQVLQKLAREGKINIEDPREAKAIIEGYQGGVDPIEVFRKTFGQDALGDLANLGDELLEIDNRGGSFKDIKKILDDEGFFDLQQPKSPAKGMTDEELMKRIKSEDPEEFATGGRVGFDDGGILSLEEAKKLNPGMFVDTTTYNPIPENAPNMAADEIAKVIMGTGFLPEEDDELGYPEGMEKPMSSKLFIFEEYVIPQRKELMENFGLTMKEADDLIRREMEKYRTNKATGGRVGFQIGGPAYDATDPIYGSSAITVTPNTIMGPQGNQIQAQMGKPSMTDRIFSGPAFDKYSAERTRAYTQSPNTFQYNIDANKAAGQFVADRTQELLGNNPVSKGLGILGQIASVPVGFYSSFAHEAAQAKDRMQPGSGVRGFLKAYDAENPIDTAAQRAAGILQSIPGIGDAVYNMGAKAYDVLNSPMGTAQAAEVDLLAPERARLIKEGIDPMSVGLIGGTGDPNQQTTTPMAGYGTTYKWDSNTGKYNLIDSQARKGQGQGFMAAGEYGDPMYGKILGLNPDNTLSIIGDFGKANTLSKEDYEYYNPNNTYGDLFNFYNTGQPGYASGGRVGFASGGAKKGVESLIEMINKKFGKGTAKKGSELEQPEAAKVKQMIDDFIERNPQTTNTDTIIMDIKKLEPIEA